MQPELTEAKTPPSPSGSRTSLLSKTSDKAIQFFKGIVYGEPNVGKTTLARTLLPLGPVLIVDCESGLAPLQDYDIDVVTVKDYSTLSQFMEELRDGTFDEYTSIFVDSLTEIGKLIEQHVFNRYAEYDASTGMSEVPGEMTFKYYGALAREIEGFVRAIRDIPGKHIFFAALLTQYEDRSTGQQISKPMLPGKKATELLPGLFDFIFAYRWVINPDTGEMSRVLFTQPYEGFIAKARQKADNPVLPMCIEKPDLSKIIRAVTRKRKVNGEAE